MGVLRVMGVVASRRLLGLLFEMACAFIAYKAQREPPQHASTTNPAAPRGHFFPKTATSTSDRDCAALSASCGDGSFESAAPTTTTDRVCECAAAGALLHAAFPGTALVFQAQARCGAPCGHCVYLAAKYPRTHTRTRALNFISFFLACARSECAPCVGPAACSHSATPVPACCAFLVAKCLQARRARRGPGGEAGLPA